MIRFKKLPRDINERIAVLARSLAKEQNIAFAYLFGGLTRTRPGNLSDVDIAIYIKNMKRFDYLDTFSTITNALGTEEVDLVVLNTAPVSFAGRILQSRNVLTDNEPFLRHKYESLTLRKYFDFSVKERDILAGRYGIGR